jgi:hypothetical protein
MNEMAHFKTVLPKLLWSILSHTNTGNMVFKAQVRKMTDVYQLSKEELWKLIDSFGRENTAVVVTDSAVRITNEYHDVEYPIRTSYYLDEWDRTVELDSDWYRRNHNLVLCYNEGRREHFFIDPVGLAHHVANYKELMTEMLKKLYER